MKRPTEDDDEYEDEFSHIGRDELLRIRS
jgi:hypothetical protein